MRGIKSERRCCSLTKIGLLTTGVVFFVGVIAPSALAQNAVAEIEIPTIDGPNILLLNATDNASNEGAITMMVDLNARDIVESADAIGVECVLKSDMVEDQEVGSGAAIFVRQGKSPAAFAELEHDTVAIFNSNSIEVSAEILFAPRSDSVPIEMWTHGECQLYLYEGNSQNPRVPQICASGQPTGGSGEGLIACVLPGTEPSSAYTIFRRPGLEGLSSASGSTADDPERSTE